MQNLVHADAHQTFLLFNIEDRPRGREEEVSVAKKITFMQL